MGMKIALFLDSFPKISETFILSQLDGLISRGHQVTLFPRSVSGERLVHPVVERHRLLEQTRFPPSQPTTLRERLTFHWRLVWVRLFRLNSVARLKDLFGNYRYMPKWRGALAEAEPVIRDKGEFDILFAHFGPNGARAAWYREAGLIRGALVTVFHGYDLTQYLRRGGADVYAALFRLGDSFLPISCFWQRKLHDLGCPPNRTRVHHMGIDCDQFAYQPRMATEGQTMRLISVARLVEKKGIEYAIRAMKQVLSVEPRVEYQIVGDGPLLTSLQALVQELGLEGRVRFLGVMTSEQVAAALSRAHVFIAPSVISASGDMEGIPTVLMEAMASGMPVVSTRHSGIPELVEDGVSGRLVAEKDVPGLAQAIIELMATSDAWAAMGKAGHEKVAREFNISTLNGVLERHFAQLSGG